jgi:hypothetical protein
VSLKKVVVRSLPFHCTTEVSTNPVPLTVRGNAALPADVFAGSRLVTVGTGLIGVRSTLLKMMSLLPVAPVLAAAIIPVVEVTFCLVEVGLLVGVIVNTQGKSNEGLVMLVCAIKLLPLPLGDASL